MAQKKPDDFDDPGRLHFTSKSDLEKQDTAKSEQADSAEFPRKSRLHFEDDAGPEVPPGTDPQNQKADRAKAKLDAKSQRLDDVRDALPKTRRLKYEREFDAVAGKSKGKLYFEETVKPQVRHSLAATAALSAGRTVNLKVHSKIREVEHENVGVEAAHKTEFTAENLAASGVRTAYRYHKNAPYARVSKLERQHSKANINYLYQKALADPPELSQSAYARFQKKRTIKKQYAKAVRNAKKRTEQAGAAAKETAGVAGSAAGAIANFAKANKGPLVIGVVVLGLFVMLSSCMSSCSSIVTGGMGSVVVSSYVSEDTDIYAANNYYTRLEQDLQSQVNSIERTHPGYDEYRYDIAEIGHNPYELTSFLTALFQSYTMDEARAVLDRLFESQYILTLREEVEVRYRTETRTGTTTSTDPDTGKITVEEYEYEVEVPYNYYILNVTLTNNTLPVSVSSTLTSDQIPLYAATLSVYGNKPYLWENIYDTASPGDYPNYQIPGDALSDPEFAAMIAEAQKYLGYPYVWGGSSPSTSFDCSGFVSWVVNHSGWSLGRLTASGLYSVCAPVSAAEAKPGDLIFFQGTYASAGPCSHVGIYVGNGMMIHCGNPIQYASIETNYWRQHFYSFGRLP